MIAVAQSLSEYMYLYNYSFDSFSFSFYEKISRLACSFIEFRKCFFLYLKVLNVNHPESFIFYIAMASLGSFFDAANCSSSSEDESEPTTPKNVADPSDEENQQGSEKLPSPTSVLLNVQRPEFLKSADKLARRDLIAEKREQLEKDRENMTGAFAPKVPVGEIPTKSLHPSAVVSSKPVLYTESSTHSTVDDGGSSESAPKAVKRTAAESGASSENADVSQPSAKKSKET